MATLDVALTTLSIGPYNAVGQVLSFQAVVSNSGSATLTGVTVTYDLSAPAVSRWPRARTTCCASVTP
jgi:hypothetical protein